MKDSVSQDSLLSDSPESTAPRALTKTGLVSLISAAMTLPAVIAYYTLMALFLDMGQDLDKRTQEMVLSGFGILVFFGIPLLTIITGAVALFQKTNPRWIPVVSVGCGCLPLTLMVLLVTAVSITGGV